jgi:DNA mismatch repair protein MutL
VAINILDPKISSLIAAGEVVERPASIVKELIENAIDAGASRIIIETINGGLDQISISDNGSGIPQKEVLMAFERFSTSKVQSINDLHAIQTLGFRGEALYSIASVSQVNIITKVAANELAFQVTLNDGHLIDSSQTSYPEGTTLTISNLFDNFPARKKFLKSPKSEALKIKTLIQKFIISYPFISFKLNPQTNNSLMSNGEGDFREAISVVYGHENSNQMISIIDEIEFGNSGLALTGFIGSIFQHKSNRTHIYIYINDRIINSRALSYAFEQAYHGFMPSKKFPIGILKLRIPFEEIDVNVHPAKTEVRLVNENKVFSMLQKSVRKALYSESLVRKIDNPRSPIYFGNKKQNPSIFWPIQSQNHPTDVANDLSFGFGKLDIYETSLKRSLSQLRILGQISSTYIVCEGHDGLYLIDQHASHERVLFEDIINRNNKNDMEIQNFLDPFVLDLEESQKEFLLENMDQMISLGFVIQEFGIDSIIVRGVPKLISERKPIDTLLEIINNKSLTSIKFESVLEKSAATIACHGSVRAGDKLEMNQMEHLLVQLQLAENSNNCPHGRPTVVKFDSKAIEISFGRR